MIKSFINKIVVDIANFECLSKDNGEYTFYQRIDQDRRRYLVLTESERLCTSEEYNEKISNCAPQNIAKSPAFDKNTDLIVLLDIKKSENFKNHERDILSIEENPYNFKKYVLYTTEEERNLLNESLFIKENISFNANEFTNFLENTEEFQKYSENPYSASLYGVIVKMHIKMPFLKIASSSNEKISNVNKILQLKLEEEQNSDFIESMLNLSEKDDLENAIKDYVNE